MCTISPPFISHNLDILPVQKLQHTPVSEMNNVMSLAVMHLCIGHPVDFILKKHVGSTYILKVMLVLKGFVKSDSKFYILLYLRSGLKSKE